jgi:Dimerisation domain
MRASQPHTEADAGLLQSMIDGYQLSQMIYVAAKLRIADLLAEGPMAIAELAEASRAHPECLRRILRALASFGPSRRFYSTLPGS